MLIALISFVAMLAVLDRTLRGGRIDLLESVTRQKLFALRDELRYATITGEISANDWVFDYLDSSLTKTAATLPRFTLFDFWACMLAERKGRSQTLHRKEFARLQQELEKPQNAKMRTIYKEHHLCLAAFLKQRHPLLSRWLFPGESSEAQTSEEIFAADAQLSTLHEYCKL